MTTLTAPPRLFTHDNHVLLAYSHKADARPGSYAHGVGLFAAPAGEWHDFVVWNVIERSHGWVCESGEYVKGGLALASEMFALRDGEL